MEESSSSWEVRKEGRKSYGKSMKKTDTGQYIKKIDDWGKGKKQDDHDETRRPERTTS